VLVGLSAFSTLIVTLSLIQGATIENLISTGITPLMPGIMLAMKAYFDQDDAAIRADALKGFSESLWRKGMESGPVADELLVECRQLQDEILEHRRRSPLLFDWVYQLLRREDEQFMNTGAEALVEEASRARRYSAQI